MTGSDITMSDCLRAGVQERANSQEGWEPKSKLLEQPFCFSDTAAMMLLATFTYICASCFPTYNYIAAGRTLFLGPRVCSKESAPMRRMRRHARYEQLTLPLSCRTKSDDDEFSSSILARRYTLFWPRRWGGPLFLGHVDIIAMAAGGRRAAGDTPSRGVGIRW